MTWCIVIAALALFGASAAAEEASPEQVRRGADIFERNCSPCHGPRMQDPESAFDLRKFPPNQHDRFVSSVTRGKNQMPPWGDMLKPDEIEALWAYVLTGGR
ncbi:MAG: cytochrome c [Alphaproteobacteria bacterium]|nr:cytochrome c [Alphaproteobacteria bacterium]